MTAKKSFHSEQKTNVDEEEKNDDDDEDEECFLNVFGLNIGHPETILKFALINETNLYSMNPDKDKRLFCTFCWLFLMRSILKLHHQHKSIFNKKVFSTFQNKKDINMKYGCIIKTF